MNKRDPRLWTAPRLWPDGECYILGGGPSLKNVDVGPLKDRRVIAVNMAYRLGDWVDVLFFGDCRWWKVNAKHLTTFAGLKVTTCQQHLDKPGVRVISRRNSPAGISDDARFVSWNNSSGACAISLAVHFGVRKITLLGFDMKANGSDHHWHEYYDRPVRTNRDPYKRFMKPFPAIAEALKSRRIECLNACPDSALDVFPKIKTEDAL